MADNTMETGPVKKQRKGRAALLAAVIVVVLVFGGAVAVYATQHDNPAFCNAVCHTPMDPYVASYQTGASVNSDQAADAPLLSVTVHKQAVEGSEIKCLSCHNDGLDAQISEGMSWISGSYTYPLEPLEIVSGEARDGQKNGAEFCLRPECHTGITSVEELVQATDVGLRNPHDTPHGKYSDCSGCHQMHEQSVNACAYCHPDAPLPEGWTKPASSPN